LFFFRFLYLFRTCRIYCCPLSLATLSPQDLFFSSVDRLYGAVFFLPLLTFALFPFPCLTISPPPATSSTLSHLSVPSDPLTQSLRGTTEFFLDFVITRPPPRFLKKRSCIPSPFYLSLFGVKCGVVPFEPHPLNFVPCPFLRCFCQDTLRS